MIRGRKPQAYNTSTKSTDSLLIPAISIDFADQKDLETKTAEIIESIADLDEAHKSTAAIVNSSLDIPKQIGTVVYNGELQAPVWDVRSSRIVISGETVGKEAGTYTAAATILNGTWKTEDEEPLAVTQPLVWTIVKKKIPKPSVNGIYVEDGTLQEVRLCDYNPKYCAVTGSTSARNAGEYNINISITNTNVTWEDDDESNSVSLSWKIVPRSSDTTNIETSVAALTSEITNLKQTVVDLKETTTTINNIISETILTDNDKTDCSCNPVISSLRRRVCILEAFTTLDSNTILDVSALITALEYDAGKMTPEMLEEEINCVASIINRALERTKDADDIRILQDLQARITNLYSINVTGKKLQDFQTTANSKKKEIEDLLENNDISGAETELGKLKQGLQDLKDDMDSDTREKLKAQFDDIESIIDALEQEITRKKVQQVLSGIENKLRDIKDKITAGEDPAALITETEDLLDTVKEMTDNNSLPYEKDKLITYNGELDDLKKQWQVMSSIKELTAMLQNIRNDMAACTETQFEKTVTHVDNRLHEIKGNTAHAILVLLDDDISRLEDYLDETKKLFWKQQQEQILGGMTTQLTNIKDTAEAANPDVTNMHQWDTELDSIDEQLGEIEEASQTREVIPDNLDSTKTLLSDVREIIFSASILTEIAATDNELDTIKEDITNGQTTYETAAEQLDIISQRITALEKDDNPDDIKNSIILLRAKLVSTRQLNNDMKVYLEVKPLLRAIRQHIYDEDLDVLWAELTAAEDKIKDAGTSSWIRELQNDIAEIKHILNSFGVNNTVENFLSHLNAAMQIIVTVTDFEPVCTTYDEAKIDLQKLEQAALTISDEELVNFPTWYSLPDKDKAYLLENGLRKIRRNVVTTEEISA